MMILIGFQNPNTTALALMPFTRRAGSASAFVGAVSMIFGSLTTWFVPTFLTTSLTPLFMLIAFCGVMAHVAVESYRLPMQQGINVVLVISPCLLAGRFCESL